MSLSICILASGSSGNCSMLRTPAGVVLVDAGLGPRTFAKSIEATDVSLNDVRAVVLTHLDSDHFKRSWVKHFVKRGITVHVADSHAADLEDETAARLGSQLRPFTADGAFSPVEGVVFQPLALAHDDTGSFGYVIDGYGGRIGFATDLGHVPPALIDQFDDLDILAIESNYDPDLQRNSGRPWFLQKRITGGSGHLSNQQALAAVKSIFDRHDKRRLPRHVVLLHRSRDCNCPDLLRTLFTRDKRIASRLVLAEPYSRTEWLCASTADSGVGRQMTLAF
ncbi:MAG TPA: MBL fold metallo-hydrolase [Tepidisphaeraceae bacterium]|jgi:phosphoribosyl 1,2-cyclic phosphodiesterase